MGTICWKCGMEVPVGATACPACGAAVAGTGGAAVQPSVPPPAAPFSSGQGYTSPPPPPSTPFQSVTPPAPPPFTPAQGTAQPGFAPVQQGYTPAPPPPPISGVPQAAAGGGGGSTVLKVILAIVGVVFLVGVLIVAGIAYIGYRAVHAVHEAAHGGAITIPGSNGTFSVNSAKSYSASELGIDIYPGATASQGGAKMELPNGSWTTGVFLTSDSKDQVIAFYKGKMSGDTSAMESDDGGVLTEKKGDKETVMVTVTARQNQNDGKTKIVILHTVGK